VAKEEKDYVRLEKLPQKVGYFLGNN